MAQPNIPAIVFGGLFLGAWLFGVFSGGLETPWTVWGLFGVAIAGGAYASRLLRDAYRILVWSGVGILSGLVLMFAIFAGEPLGILAILLTATGGGLITSALPPQPQPGPGAVPPAYPYAHGQYDPHNPPAYGYGYAGYAPQDPYQHAAHDPYGQAQGHTQAPYGYGQPAYDPYAQGQQGYDQAPASAPAQGSQDPQQQHDAWALREEEDEKRRRKRGPRDHFDPNYH